MSNLTATVKVRRAWKRSTTPSLTLQIKLFQRAMRCYLQARISVLFVIVRRHLDGVDRTRCVTIGSLERHALLVTEGYEARSKKSSRKGARNREVSRSLTISRSERGRDWLDLGKKSESPINVVKIAVR